MGFLFMVNTTVNAHEIRPGFLQIEQIDETTYNVFWKIPRLGDAIPKIYLNFPIDFIVDELKKPNPIPGFLLYAYQIKSKSPLNGQTIGIDGLSKTLIDVLVNVTFLNGEKISFMLQPNKAYMVIPAKETVMNTVKTYLILGFEHILLGIDHLLFVLALLLITPGFKKLIKTITAFTIAHSITLSLSALGFIGLPGPPVEAVIALSIVFLALEVIKYNKGGQSIAIKHPWLVAFSFGLLHGFGFAGALTSIGLPQTTIPAALLFFNVGVEIGQIAFISFVLVFIWIITKSKLSFPKWTKLVPVYGIGSLASFWLIERVVGFWI